MLPATSASTAATVWTHQRRHCCRLHSAELSDRQPYVGQILTCHHRDQVNTGQHITDSVDYNNSMVFSDKSRFQLRRC